MNLERRTRAAHPSSYAGADVRDSELALVGCLMEAPDLCCEVKPGWFDDLRLSNVVVSITTLNGLGKPVNIWSITHDSAIIGLIQECQEKCHSAANFQYWRDIVFDHSEKRRLLNAAQSFIDRVPGSNGDLKALVLELENSLASTSIAQGKTINSRECALALVDSLEDRMRLNGARSGLATGFSDLDRVLDGVQFGEVTVLASRPSVGKTAIGCNIVEKVCLRDKVPTLFLSLEMGASALARRMLASNQQIQMNTLKSGRFTKGDFARFAIFDSILKQSPLHIRESFGGMTASEAGSLIRRAVRRDKIRFVVLDYLQKIKPDHKHEKRTYEIAESSAAIVSAVRDTGVAMLCLAQLNRESEREKGRLPRLSDLADSGQIERDADNVLLLHRLKGEPEAKLIIAKQRDGEVGTVTLQFDGRYCRFRDTTNQNEPTPSQRTDGSIPP